jgi:hypothetical protein
VLGFLCYFSRVNFESWLTSKKIDAEAFRKAENGLFKQWESEFDQMHPNSFTVQKLNLINPLRRKYHLAGSSSLIQTPATEATAPKVVQKPMMRPKPKIN